MNDLLTRSILRSSHSALDLSQQGLGTSPIEDLMSSRRTCLCCSTVLLRHIRIGGLYGCVVPVMQRCPFDEYPSATVFRLNNFE